MDIWGTFSVWGQSGGGTGYLRCSVFSFGSLTQLDEALCWPQSQPAVSRRLDQRPPEVPPSRNDPVSLWMSHVGWSVLPVLLRGGPLWCETQQMWAWFGHWLLKCTPNSSSVPMCFCFSLTSNQILCSSPPPPVQNNNNNKNSWHHILLIASLSCFSFVLLISVSAPINFRIFLCLYRALDTYIMLSGVLLFYGLCQSPAFIAVFSVSVVNPLSRSLDCC